VVERLRREALLGEEVYILDQFVVQREGDFFDLGRDRCRDLSASFDDLLAADRDGSPAVRLSLVGRHCRSLMAILASNGRKKQ